MIYLDNAATTFPKPEEVYQAMDQANRNLSVNAGRGSYKKALEAESLIEETRKELLKLVKSSGYEKAVLTGSATLALNIILKGINWKENDIVYVSPYEHNAVARTLHHIQKEKKIILRMLPLHPENLAIDLERMKDLFLQYPPVCVCCTHVSNVTGYKLPVREIFEVAKEYQAVTVLDASQSFGLLPISMQEIPADFIAFAGHKTLYGPFGIAGFIDRNTVPLQTVLTGGTGTDSLNLEMPKALPNHYEAGSKNIVAIAGLHQALKLLNQEAIYQKEIHLTKELVNRLQTIEGLELYLPKDYETNQISVVSFNILGYQANEVGTILDKDFDIAVRTGYHCAPWIHHYLKDEGYHGTVRVGLGQFNTPEEIEKLAEAVEELAEEV